MWFLNRFGKIILVESVKEKKEEKLVAESDLVETKNNIAPYYRDLGFVLYYGMTTKDIMLSAFGKHEDPNSAGRQMPNHFGDKKRKIITGSSPVTTQVPHAVGFALASKIKNDPFVTFTT